MQTAPPFAPMMQHHPCNRFGFGHHQVVNYAPAMHQSYQHHQQDYSANQQAKAAGNWPMVSGHHHHHQQFSTSVVSGRDMPLTPPADREAVAAAPAVQPYYTGMLHGPASSGSNSVGGNIVNYSPSPVDKSMTPPQDVHHHHQHHHQQPVESMGWWAPSSVVPPTHQTDFSFHHHHQQQMLAHHSAAAAIVHQPTTSPCNNTTTTPTNNNSNITGTTPSSPNPSEFQQRVAAALLKTHATLASRRCRRCRCPNCQVTSQHLSASFARK